MRSPHPSLFFEGWGARSGRLKKREQSRTSFRLGYEQVATLLGGCEEREYFLGNVPGLQFTF